MSASTHRNVGVRRLHAPGLIELGVALSVTPSRCGIHAGERPACCSHGAGTVGAATPGLPRLDFGARRGELFVRGGGPRFLARVRRLDTFSALLLQLGDAVEPSVHVQPSCLLDQQLVRPPRLLQLPLEGAGRARRRGGQAGRAAGQMAQRSAESRRSVPARVRGPTW